MTDDKDIELAEAEALRRALEGDGETDGETAELLRLAERVRASSAQAAPLGVDIRDRALEAALAGMSSDSTQEKGGEVIRGPWARWTIMTLAAGLAAALIGYVVFRNRTTTMELPDEAYASPTDDLFDGPFPEDQSPAERADRILAARTRGYFAGLTAEPLDLEASRGQYVQEAEARLALLTSGEEE